MDLWSAVEPGGRTLVRLLGFLLWGGLESSLFSIYMSQRLRSVESLRLLHGVRSVLGCEDCSVFYSYSIRFDEG